MSDSDIEMVDVKAEAGPSSGNCITLSDSDDEAESEIKPMRPAHSARKSAPSQYVPSLAARAARKSAPSTHIQAGLSQRALAREVHGSRPSRKDASLRPDLPGSGWSDRSASRDSSAAVEELGNRLRAIEIIRPDQLTLSVEITELRLPSSSLPASSPSTNETILLVETKLTIACTDSLQYLDLNDAKRDSDTKLSHSLWRPRLKSTQRSPATSYSSLVPCTPFSLSFDLAAPSCDASDNTPLLDATLTLSIIDPSSKALIFNEKIQLVENLQLVLGETRHLRPLDEPEAYAELTWRWKVPRSATTIGVMARESGGQKAGQGKLTGQKMEKILERALEAEDRKVKLEMLSSTEALSELDGSTLEALQNHTKRSAFRQRGSSSRFHPLPRRPIALEPAINSTRAYLDTMPFPRSSHVAFTTLGTPHPSADLELPPSVAHPSAKTLEDRSLESEVKEENVATTMFEELLYVEEPKRAPEAREPEERGVGLRKVGVDGRVKILQQAEVATIFNSDSFSPREQLHTIRDFSGLFTLVSHLAVDSARLKSPELAGHVDAIDFERFLAENDVEVGRELRTAFDVFAKRVGRTAYEVQRAHRAFSFEEVVSDPCRPPMCAMCGARSCSVHLPDTSADNVPTSTSYANKHKQHQKNVSPSFTETVCLPGCGYQKQAPSTAPWTNEEKSECDALIQAMPELIACQMALMVRKHCAEVSAYFQARGHSPTPLQPLASSSPTIQSRNLPDSLAFPVSLSQGYDPCTCGGHCSTAQMQEGAACLCLRYGSWCDHYCGCAADCPRRFRGCNCSSSDNACRSESCPCWLAARECDPLLCACSTPDCRSSQIRRRDLKRTIVVESINPEAGYGLTMLESARTGDLIGLYGGEAFDLGDPFGRLASETTIAVKTSYWYDLDSEHAIDSQQYGNAIRYINDLGNHNCDARLTYIDGVHQMALYASKDFKARDELSLDYGKGYWHNCVGVQRGIDA